MDNGIFTNISNENLKKFENQIFAKTNYSNLYLDEYSCYVQCYWIFKDECYYIIIDGLTCYYIDKYHTSGLAVENVEISSNALLIQSKLFI